MKLRVAVLLSGSGTTLQNILDRAAAGSLDVEVVCVVASREDAYGLERARQAGIPAQAVVRKDFADADAFSAAVWAIVDQRDPGLVVLAGFMSLLRVPAKYDGKIMNVHPAMIPAFSGKGMYGHHVHQAVLDYGVKYTGVTVHFVNDEYDRGPVILQRPVPVEEGDTAETLAARVQENERDLYPEAIQLFAENRLRLDGRHVHILPPREDV
jgi:phosphoribosylglycinamide formyltransferase-1